MKNVSYSQAETAPIQLKEAQVFPLYATRHNLHPAVIEMLGTYFQKLQDETERRLMSNPVKPGSHYEIMGKAWKELSDYASAVRHNDVQKSKAELFDLVVNLVLLGSTSDHLIKID